MKETVPQYNKLNFVSSVLVRVVQELSLAHSLEDITTVVRAAARALVHADGATFVLRDGEQCHYVDEDAITGLWKGMKFPLNSCISGWCMLHKEQLTIEDIYKDDRIPHDAYRPTFVKSLAMTPIRKNKPIGSIGTYWGKSYVPSEEELEALQALADATSIAINNVNTINELHEHTENLEKINRQLNRYTWIVSHDLKEPLRGLSLNLSLLESDLLDQGKISKKDLTYNYIERMHSSISTSEQLISDILTIAKIEHYQNSFTSVSLQKIVSDTLNLFNDTIFKMSCKVEYENLPSVHADPVLLSRVFQNIISNSLKFQKDELHPEIKISASLNGSNWVVSIQDKGIGITSDYHEKVFDFFTHIHNRRDFPGSGVGLSICKKIIEDFGGKIWIESPPGKGCIVSFTLPRDVDEKF